MDGQILLVASTDKSRELLLSLIPQKGREQLRVCSSSAEARRAAQNGSFSLIIINTPLSDESGLDLAIELSGSTFAGVMLLVKSDLCDAVASRVENYGIVVISKPVIRQLFDQSMRMMELMQVRLNALQSENERLRQKLNDQRLVDRAKCVLIEHLSMTEDQAHRHIEKQAMDTRQTRVAVARSIISAYSL